MNGIAFSDRPANTRAVTASQGTPLTLRFGLALLALGATALPTMADGPLPSMISFGTSEKYVSLYGKGGPRSERFTMEGRKALQSDGKRLLGGGYAGTCSGLPPDYGADVNNTARFLYRIGENVTLDFSCKYSLWMAHVKMTSTSSYEGGLLTLRARVDYKRSDGKETGHGEEEAVIDLANGKCRVKTYRLVAASREQGSYSTDRERTDTAANVACYRMK